MNFYPQTKYTVIGMGNKLELLVILILIASPLFPIQTTLLF